MRARTAKRKVAPSHRAWRYGAIGAGIVGALVLLVLLFPWNVLRGPLAHYASARFDRQVTIAGDLHVDLGWSTRVQIDGVSIANTAWSQEQPMVAAKRVIFWFTPMALLRAEPSRVRLIDIGVSLQRTADGDDNWHLGHITPSRIGNVEVDRGLVRFRDAKEHADIALELQTIDAAGDRTSSLRFSGRGSVHGEAVQIDGESLGLAQLQDTNDPYRLKLAIKAGRSVANFEGTIIPSNSDDVHGVLRVQGPDLSKLYPLIPAPLPWTAAYNLAGDLSHTKGLWDLRGVKGTVGESDLKGDVRIDVSKPRTLLTADITSARFDSKDLGGFVGLPPGDGAKGARTAEQKAETRKRAVSSHVLPDKPFELAKWREHDADIKFRGTSVKWSALPLDNLTTRINLKDGVMRLEPLDFGIADGHVVANIVLDASRDIPKAQGDVEARNVELKRIFPKLASPNGTAGRFGGRAHFKAEGRSVAAMMASLDADASVIMRGGEASTLQLVLTNLDLARAAELLLRGDETAEIRCAVGALHAKAGIMTPDTFLVDTSAVVISGEGSVDFRNEQYDLALKAKSKRMSLLALRGPIVINGTFKTPIVGPAVVPIVARVAAAVALGAVAAPLALLPLIDFGGASDVDCKALIEQAQIATATTGRIARPGRPKIAAGR
ncbi:MAG: AsmA family protein [Casimicrobiaceae bacterium]